MKPLHTYKFKSGYMLFYSSLAAINFFNFVILAGIYGSYNISLFFISFLFALFAILWRRESLVVYRLFFEFRPSAMSPMHLVRLQDITQVAFKQNALRISQQNGKTITIRLGKFQKSDRLSILGHFSAFAHV